MSIFKKPGLPAYLHLSDIQGLAQLAAQATLGVTGLAEKVQGNVYKAVAAPFGAAGQKFVDRAAGSSGVNKRGITGLVYGSIKGVTRLAAGGVDAVLSRVPVPAGPKASSPQREAVLSALNGVLGDQLMETGNPLAIAMSLRQGGEPLPMDKTALAQRLPRATGKVLVLIHGLCMNDLQWRPPSVSEKERDFGDGLARELGYTPVYLHYNTGLHTSTNGGQFAALLEQLVKDWPQPVEELTLLAHSMGGLVARSACHSAANQQHSWLGKLKHLVFLGTPHHGAPLERVGSWVDTALGSNIVTRPFAKIGQIRSAGITDLRHGHVVQEDWQGADRFSDAVDRRRAVPLPAGVGCYAVAGTLGVQDKLLGDGLVPLGSALGQHDDPAHVLDFPPQRQWVARETGHMALLHSPAVYAQVKSWLRQDA